MKPVLANLGFVLQTTGLLILLSVVVAFLYDEKEAVISFFISSVVFLGAGFLMNALCERKDLDFKSSCVLITIVFFLLGAIGSIPYLYNNIFYDSDTISKIINSFFESVSGFTTTGLTFISNPDSLPKSIVFYRSLTQWIGGIGIVFILLAFFYSERVLNSLSKAMGFESITSTLKKTYIEVFLVYTIYVLIFIGVFYFFGIKDLLYNTSLVFSTISTGGFSPISNFSTFLSFPNNFILSILMILGSTSFIVHHKLFTGKFGNAFTTEFITLILIIFSFTIILSILSNLDIITAFFHSVSASTTTGYSFIDFKYFSPSIKILFIFIMFVGGCAFSTSGGIKILRFLIFLKSIPWIIKGAIKGNLDKFTFEGKEFKTTDVLSYLLLILLAISMIFSFAFVFTLYGFDFIDSIFELTSAFATTGISVGITNVSLPIVLKIVLVLVMVLGRIEIITLLVAIMPLAKEEKLTNE
jgi:trk system potassium uptake protein TrkH